MELTCTAEPRFYSFIGQAPFLDHTILKTKFPYFGGNYVKIETIYFGRGYECQNEPYFLIDPHPPPPRWGWALPAPQLLAGMYRFLFDQSPAVPYYSRSTFYLFPDFLLRWNSVELDKEKVCIATYVTGRAGPGTRLLFRGWCLVARVVRRDPTSIIFYNATYSFR